MHDKRFLYVRTISYMCNEVFMLIEGAVKKTANKPEDHISSTSDRKENEIRKPT